MTMNTMAERLGAFVAGLHEAAIPDDVLERARVCLVFGYGMAANGRAIAQAKIAHDAALAMDGERSSGGATLLLSGRRSSVAGAAFANAGLFNARAQEDTVGTVHMGAIAIPLLTAMLESGDHGPEASARFLPALVAAYEVSGLFDQAFGARTSAKGFRATALYGALGAAAAAARMMGLDAQGCASALANVASFSGGLLQAFADESDEWRYQLGVAGRTGLAAAALAQAGSLAGRRAFEGHAGFLQAFVDAQAVAQAADLTERLGKDWALHRTRFKPYPVCASNQTMTTVALTLHARLREAMRAQPIKAVRVRMPPHRIAYPGQAEKGPFTNLTGTVMSVPFGIAATLLYGMPDFKRLQTFDDPAVNDLAQRVELVPDTSLTAQCSIIEVTLQDGRTDSESLMLREQDYAYGWEQAAGLVRQVGAHEGVDPGVFQRIERFARHAPAAPLQDVINAFRDDAAALRTASADAARRDVLSRAPSLSASH